MNLLHLLAALGVIHLVLDVAVVVFLLVFLKDQREAHAVADAITAKQKAEKRPLAG